MRGYIATHTGLAVTGILGRPACPRCGEMLFAAVATEFRGKGRISNSWSICNSWICDSCDHEFRTAVEIKGPAK